MLRIACCDDSELLLDILAEQLSDYFEERKIKGKPIKFTAARDLLNSVKEGNIYDIFILDLIMPSMSGMELAHKLKEINKDALIIFLSSSTEGLLESYDVDTFYYLLKPIDTKKLYFVLDKAADFISKNSLNIIDVKTKKGEVRLPVENITYIDIINRCLNYHLFDKTSHETTMLRVPFSKAVEPFAVYEFFAMCGSSILVNLDQVVSVSVEEINLKNGDVIYPPRNAYKAFKDAWSAHFKIA